MQAFCKNICWFGSVAINPKFSIYGKRTSANFFQQTSGNSKFHGFGTQWESLTSCDGIRSFSSLYNCLGLGNSQIGMADLCFPVRFLTTMDKNEKSTVNCDSAIIPGVVPRIKFKRPDKTAGHIMQILDKEAVGQVREVREIPDVQPGCILQLKVEVPENKRRVSLIKGIVIAKRNAGLNTTFRLRRMVAGVGVESVYPLYSPNIKEIKVLERKKVRRAKLYYLRDKMNALKGSKA